MGIKVTFDVNEVTERYLDGWQGTEQGEIRKKNPT